MAGTTFDHPNIQLYVRSLASPGENVRGRTPDLDGLTARARWPQLLLLVVLVFDFVAVGSDITSFRLLGTEFSLEDADATDSRQLVVGTIQFVLVLTTAVFFIRWFKRAYENVQPLGGRRRYRIGWTIGSWFVPILNLFRPKQIANDIWRGTNPRVPLTTSEHVSPLLTLWWAAFLASTLISNLAEGAWTDAETTQGLRTSAAMNAAADTIDIAAAVLAIWAIRTITARQTAAGRALQARRQTLGTRLNRGVET